MQHSRLQTEICVRQCPTTCSMWNSGFSGPHDVEVMDWSAVSPNMNPMEMSGIKCQSGVEAWIVPLPIWPDCVKRSAVCGTHFSKRLRALVESMPHCVRAVLAARGGHMRYRLYYYIGYYLTYPITMGFGHLAFELLYSNANSDNVAVNCCLYRT